jgi:hypothetical protein
MRYGVWGWSNEFTHLARGGRGVWSSADIWGNLFGLADSQLASRVVERKGNEASALRDATYLPQ